MRRSPHKFKLNQKRRERLGKSRRQAYGTSLERQGRGATLGKMSDHYVRSDNTSRAYY